MKLPVDNEERLRKAHEADMAAATHLEERCAALSDQLECIAERVDELEEVAHDAPEARQHYKDAGLLLKKGRRLHDEAQRRLDTMPHPSFRKTTATLLMDCATQLRLADEALDRTATYGADNGSAFRR